MYDNVKSLALLCFCADWCFAGLKMTRETIYISYVYVKLVKKKTVDMELT